ncbi:MAG: hypothetical protein HAW66_02005, partial [Shewanella sp.]|nr:hypothetical protein [Shewanella sp.]
EDSSPNIKNRLAEVDQPVVPFIAFFGKGKQSAMLTEAPIFIPVE